jgi:hypothetical protein
MLSQIIWWGIIALEILLLVRAFRGRLAAHYPIFYIYISFVLSQDLLRLFVYQRESRFYAPVYWVTEFLGVVTGCAVVFEICRVALLAYPGTGRLARNLLAIGFVLACTNAAVAASNDAHRWIATCVNLERDVRLVQAITILALVALFLVYSIPFGRNLRGILIGYGLFIGLSVIQLAFVAVIGNMSSKFLAYLHPVSYALALCVWVGHLWAYRSNPEPERAFAFEQQYARVAAATRYRLREARGYLEKAVHP